MDRQRLENFLKSIKIARNGLSDDVAFTIPALYPEWKTEQEYAAGDRVFANTIPEWEQPDSTNPYKKGDKVTYQGKTWISTVDNNVWAPGTYGWSEVTE